MGVNISKCYPPYSYDCFNQTFAKYSPWHSSQQLLIGMLKFQIYLNKKTLKFIIVANGKMKNCQ